MSISDEERKIFVSLIAGVAMGKFALVESTEKATGKRVLALVTPNRDNPIEASVFATMSVADLRETIEPTEHGDTLGMGGSPLFTRVSQDDEPVATDTGCDTCGNMECPKHPAHGKQLN